MEKASLNHSVYMSTVKQLTHNEVKTKRNFYGQNAKQRMIKATYGLFYLSKNKSKLIESIALIESDIKTLDIEKLVDEIQTKLDLDKKTSSNNSKMGYGIILKQNKTLLNIYATRILGDWKPLQISLYATPSSISLYFSFSTTFLSVKPWFV